MNSVSYDSKHINEINFVNIKSLKKNLIGIILNLNFFFSIQISLRGFLVQNY